MEANEFNRKKVLEGVKLLKAKYGYDQVDIVAKLAILNTKTSTTSFNRILNNTGKVGDGMLLKVAKGILKLIEEELCLCYDEEQQKFIGISDKEPNIIDIPKGPKIENGYRFYPNGRLSLQKKVDFMNTAQKEVIEFGTRLHSFADYFIKRGDYEFKERITSLLERGVNVKVYMLDADSNYARLYFEDCSQVEEIKEDHVRIMETSKQILEREAKNYKALELKGKLELYTYKHIPRNHFLIIDGKSPNAKMLVSHYLYGIERSKCPVLEIHKDQNRDLYNRYWKSFKSLTEG